MAFFLICMQRISQISHHITNSNIMKRSVLSLALLLLSFTLYSQNLTKGIDLFKQGKLDAAKSSLKSIKSKSSDYEKAQYYLGRIAFDQNKFGDAVDYFKEAIDENDKSSDYYTWLGNSYGRLAQNSSKIRQGFIAPKIKKNYEKAVSFDAENLDAHWGLVEYYTQAPAFMGGSWEKAENSANNILKFNEKEGHRALVTVYLRQEKNQEAEQAYMKLVEIAPDFNMAFATFYQNTGAFDKAFDLFEKIYAESEENIGALYQVGKTSALSGQKTDRGIEALELYLNMEVKEGTPSHAGAKMRLAMIYEKLGNKNKAKSLYTQALKDEPEMEQAKAGLKRLKK